jgi:hypothetical protein
MQERKKCMDDWKYLKKLELTKKYGVMKGIAIAFLLLLFAGLVIWAVKNCVLKNGACCAGAKEEDECLDENDFEDEEE